MHLLNASGSLMPFKKDIESITKISVKKIVNVIPVSDVDIVLYEDPQSAISHLGIGGYTPNAHLVFIPFDTRHKHLRNSIRERLEGTIAHELHHALRKRILGYGDTLLEAMISEGLADHFDIEITNKEPDQWDTALTDKQMTAFHKKAKKEYFNKKYDRSAWFFGSKGKGIPKWAGYTLGFNIVSAYLKKHPDKKPSQLYRTRAEEFIG